MSALQRGTSRLQEQKFFLKKEAGGLTWSFLNVIFIHSEAASKSISTGMKPTAPHGPIKVKLLV